MIRTRRQYSEETKATILSLLRPPFNKDHKEISKEKGIPPSTVYTWLKQEEVKAKSMNTSPKITKIVNKQVSAESRLAIIIETATMSEVELSAYCRKHGLYPEDISTWKQAFIESVGSPMSLKTKEKHLPSNQDKKRIKALEKELKRKEKALAEAAALLILRKKLEAFYGEGNEDD